MLPKRFSVHRIRLFFLAIILSAPIVSASASPVVLTDIHGVKTPFSALRGQWVFINYWASWCQPCLEEISELNQFYQQKNQHIAMYAVNFDALPISQQLGLINKYHIRYPSLAKDPGPELGLGDIRGVPVTFVFDPQGNLADTLWGGQTQASLTKVLTTHQRS
jgi:thiol-disulfide isomerase/thioredoxin